MCDRSIHYVSSTLQRALITVRTLFRPLLESLFRAVHTVGMPAGVREAVACV
jgi:hypothetical protein